MANSLYDISVTPYMQIIGSVSGLLAKGAEHYREQGADIEEMVDYRLKEDMLPFSFQIRSVVHHSLGAMRGLESGEFRPPPSVPDMNYAGLQALLEDAGEQLQGLSREAIDACAGGSVIFRLETMEVPFTAENFITSFSLPNFYFHATTAYDMLRLKGVPLGKLDFLGQMRVG